MTQKPAHKMSHEELKKHLLDHKVLEYRQPWGVNRSVYGIAKDTTPNQQVVSLDTKTGIWYPKDEGGAITGVLGMQHDNIRQISSDYSLIIIDILRHTYVTMYDIKNSTTHPYIRNWLRFGRENAKHPNFIQGGILSINKNTGEAEYTKRGNQLDPNFRPFGLVQFGGGENFAFQWITMDSGAPFQIFHEEESVDTEPNALKLIDLQDISTFEDFNVPDHVVKNSLKLLRTFILLAGHRGGDLEKMVFTEAHKVIKNWTEQTLEHK